MHIPIHPAAAASLGERDWRAAAPPGRRLLFAATRALAGRPTDGAVLARTTLRGRSLEILCVGNDDVLPLLAPIAARFGAELVVRCVDDGDDPAIRLALRRGAVIVAGTLRRERGPGLAHAPV